MSDAKYGFEGIAAAPTNNDLPPTEAQPGDYDLPDEPVGCAYCDSLDVFRPEPFGGRDACVRCWNRICLDDDSDLPFRCADTEEATDGP